MLRTSRYRHKGGVCWEDSIQESTPETAPERQGNLVFYDFVSYMGLNARKPVFGS